MRITTVWKWENKDIFGSNLPTVSTIEYNLRFSGQYFDKENKLHYNINRTYNPQLGRYMQSDPKGLAAGFNTYNYVKNNPVNAVDPSGLLTRLLVDEGKYLDIGHVALEINNQVYSLHPNYINRNGVRENYSSTVLLDNISGVKGEIRVESLEKFIKNYNSLGETIYAYTLDVTSSQEKLLENSFLNDKILSDAGKVMYNGIPFNHENCASYIWTKLNKYTDFKYSNNPLFPWMTRARFNLRMRTMENSGILATKIYEPQ